MQRQQRDRDSPGVPSRRAIRTEEVLHICLLIDQHVGFVFTLNCTWAFLLDPGVLFSKLEFPETFYD